MASGKQSRRKRAESGAGAPPPVRSKGQKRQASPKVLLGAAAVIAIVAVAVGLAVGLSGGSSSKKPTSLSSAVVATAKKLLNGIPQNGTVLGSAKAPVTLVEYIDLQCPFCQEFETTVMPGVLKTYVRTGKVKIEARPLAFIGPDSVRGRDVVLAAAKQNHMFDVMELLYLEQGKENTGWLTDGLIKSIAASITGLDQAKLLTDRDSAAVKTQGGKYDTLAQADNVTGTPTILVGKSGKQLETVVLSSMSDSASVNAMIDAALK